LLKKCLLLIILFTGAILVGGCDGEPESGEQETFEFSLAHFFPANHPAETELVQGWAQEINEATDGRVTITSYPGETLSDADEIYNAVTSGIADIGLSCFSYTRGRFPVLEAFELPGIVYETSWAASKTAWEGIQKLDPEEVQDTQLMFVLATGPGDLFTTTPVNNLEDLQGMNIRATGLSAETLEELGATPDAMPQSEAYEALARGMVQGNLSPVEVLEGWNHGEVTDYLTRTPFLYNTLFFVTMNQEKWDRLPADIQTTIEEVNEAFFEEVACSLWDEQNSSAWEWAVEETGQELIELSESEAERWIEKVQPIQEKYKENMEAAGHDGAEILEMVQELAETYAEEYDEAN